MLDPWFGDPKRSASNGLVTLEYRIKSEEEFLLKLKVEINTREHFSILGYSEQSLSSNSSWFAGSANITTFKIEELLGTKMRALYQRRKGRDLYDIYKALTTITYINTSEIVRCFNGYLNKSGLYITRQQFLNNLDKKLNNEAFMGDIIKLLPPGSINFETHEAYAYVRKYLIDHLG